jgi:D-3-phosphoglycerate dehydrogenase
MEERKRFKIVIAESQDFSKAAEKRLLQLGNITKGPFSGNQLKATCQDANILVLRLGHYIDASFFKNTHLKFILTPTTGLDHIDLVAAQQKNVEIISLKGQTGFLEQIPSTAEHSWALMLALLRKIPAAHQDVMKGNWNRDAFKSRNLNALTLGILGFGRVGKQISNYAEAFGMPYRFFDIAPELKNHPNAAKDINELLAQSDVLSVHIPLNAENTNFLNKEKLQHLKNGALLINTSRGEVVDENEVVNALKNGKISGVATDVLTDELHPEKRRKSPLLAYAKKNETVIITPHIAGATLDSMHLTEEFVVDQLLKCINK